MNDAPHTEVRTFAARKNRMDSSCLHYRVSAVTRVPPISQRKARIAGLLYIGTIVAGIFAEVFVRSHLQVSDLPSATAANILNHIELYRAGEAADLVMLCCYVAVTTLLYEMFAGAYRQLALLASAFSLVGIATLTSSGLLHMAPLALLDGTAGRGIPPTLRDALIDLSLDLHGDVYNISLVFFGIYCMLIGYLAIRTRLLPVAIGGLMMLGGACHVLTKFGALLSPEFVHALPRPLDIAPMIGELALAIWLLVFGIRQPRAE